ncbi:hypothetical protein CFC21_017432 [Triticum aestivum]|uniref:Uncharacterized protein n=2 Tax=Triticum aestivum TaxID=4565 RepID=A0A3B6AZX7_WHEAT|nr:uncharacterized protein LOC123189258 [Triticum aestivum]KAF7001851.1 hypothetical protein CFC21_017432 [Triticum aestivum]
MDDFTFPTTAAAAEHAEPLFLHHHHRLLPFPHFASSPLWFPGDGVAVAPVAAVVSRRTADGMEEQEPTSSDSAAGRRSKGERGGEADEEGAVVRATGADGEDKMDKLWENFNEELEALRRAGSCPKKTAAACGLDELSDTESEAGERGRGCAPMLRASSRAGATGQYYRRSGSWVLLMRIFKRLFVVEKTAVSAAHRRHKANAAE